MKLPPRVREQGGRYYLVSQSQERSERGKLKRLWIKLSRVEDGPAALYDALAALHRMPSETSMPAVIEAWRRDELPGYRVLKTRKDYERMSYVLAKALEAFDVSQIEPADVADLIDQWKDKPRTANGLRSLLSVIIQWAIRKRYRVDNPVKEIARFKERKRTRYLADDELERIKQHGSPWLAALIDLALVTGQRVGDLLALRWSDVSDKGVVFRPSKVEETTAVAVPIRMTPRLRAALDRCRAAPKVPSLVHVCSSIRGQRLPYNTVYSAWTEACAAAGVVDANIHDLKHRALTDAERQGKDSRRLGGHSSKAMTQRYIEAAGLDWIDPPEVESVENLLRLP